MARSNKMAEISQNHKVIRGTKLKYNNKLTFLALVQVSLAAWQGILIKILEKRSHSCFSYNGKIIFH